MLAKDEIRVSTLRMLKSALGYLRIERKTEALSDGDIVGVIQKELKKRREAIEQYKTGNRPELVDREQKEAAVLESFLPQPLSDSELEELVRTTIQEVSATSKKDMGAVIRAVQAKAAGRADGKAISAAVGKLLP
jgi:uncharacterized protein YqeY